MTLLLSETDVRQLLSLRNAIDLMEQGFADLASEKVLMPQRLMMRLASADGLMALMPAYANGGGALGYKSVTSFANNPHLNLPLVLSIILILDPHSGQTLVIMDGTYITAVRTAAGSGVATRYLARPDSRVLGVLGSGAQAQAHIRVMCEILPIQQVRMFSPNLEHKHAEVLQALADLHQVTIQAVDTAQAAVENCDVVVLSTSAREPVIRRDWLSPGTHINAVGSHAPGMREIDTETLLSAKVVCDSIEACLVEAGDILIPIGEQRFEARRLHASLGEVVLGRKARRESDTEITLFKSVGLAVQDVLTGNYVYQQARLRGVGREFDFSS